MRIGQSQTLIILCCDQFTSTQHSLSIKRKSCSTSLSIFSLQRREPKNNTPER